MQANLYKHFNIYLQERNNLRRHKAGPLHRSVSDEVDQLHEGGGGEGGLSRYHLVHNAAQGPQICLNNYTLAVLNSTYIHADQL